MPNYVLTFVAALIVSLAVTPLVMKLAEVTGAMDAPDARKVHKKPIPRIGGIGIFTAFMISFIALTDFDALVPEVSRGLMGLLIGASIIVLVGIIDDYKEELWAVQADNMSGSLIDLRKYEDVKSCFAFGDKHHITIK